MEDQAQRPRAWDPIVKLTHWGVVTAVIANAIFTEEGSGWHIWVGYGLAALLALRLLWGLIGPAEARFSAFPPSPRRALAHIGEIRRGEVVRHRSHNPLGAMMAYAIWATLLVIAASGIAMSGPPPADPNAVSGERGEGGKGEAGAEEGEENENERADLTVGSFLIAPAFADEDGAQGEGGDGAGESGEELFEEIHEIAVNLLYVLIALHLAGVMFETRRSGREIVGSMIPGGNRRN